MRAWRWVTGEGGGRAGSYVGGLVLAPSRGDAPASSTLASPSVKLTLLAEDRVRYELTTGPFTVDAPSADTEFSPFHMLGGSLASCTFTVLASWAGHAKLDFTDLVIEVAWTFAEQPHRVGTMAIELRWPSLPANRREAARRTANLCTVHHTLEHPPALTTVMHDAASVPTAPAAEEAAASAPPTVAPAGEAA